MDVHIPLQSVTHHLTKYLYLELWSSLIHCHKAVFQKCSTYSFFKKEMLFSIDPIKKVKVKRKVRDTRGIDTTLLYKMKEEYVFMFYSNNKRIQEKNV